MDVLKIYNKLTKYPFGDKIFNLAICKNAPYFSTISPEVLVFKEGHCEFTMKKRRSVENHLKTVHAIAMCNLAEVCGGMLMEAIVDDKTQRWIPKGMKVRYLKKARTDLRGVVKYPKEDIVMGSNFLRVDVFDSNNEIVFDAEIEMHVSEKKKKE